MAVTSTSALNDPAVASEGAEASDWLNPYLRWTRVPSWFLSAVIHVGLILGWIALSQMDGCRGDVGVGEGEGFREVGLVLRPSDAEANESDRVATRRAAVAAQPDNGIDSSRRTCR